MQKSQLTQAHHSSLARIKSRNLMASFIFMRHLLQALCFVQCLAMMEATNNVISRPLPTAEYDEIEPLDPNCDANSTYAVWQPSLQVVGGLCPSYPAVSIDGTVSRGLLRKFLTPNCRPSRGQVYSRKHRFKDLTTIVVWCWYFPRVDLYPSSWYEFWCIHVS